MRIRIAQRYRPFSHRPGASCLLPRTSFVVEAFPTLLRIEGLYDIPLNHRGPVHEFTLLQDLEKGCVFLSGIAKGGRFRICIEAKEREILVNGERFSHSGVYREPLFPLERLSLGSHRAQDWDLVMRRCDLREILPLLFHLSQWIPDEGGAQSNLFTLLKKGEWEFFVRAAFSGILTPRLADEEHQGLAPWEKDPKGAPSALVVRAGEQIRSLFFRQEGSRLSFLSAEAYEAGRMTDLHVQGMGSLDFEWRKRLLRRVVLRPVKQSVIQIDAFGSFSSYRLRGSRQEKGFHVQIGKEITLEAGKVYFADRFQK